MKVNIVDEVKLVLQRLIRVEFSFLFSFTAFSSPYYLSLLAPCHDSL